MLSLSSHLFLLSFIVTEKGATSWETTKERSQVVTSNATKLLY